MKFSYPLFLVASLSLFISVGRATADSACNNTADITAFHDHWKTFRSDVQTCTVKCLSRDACVAHCLQDQIGLTYPCAECFGLGVKCVRKNCWYSCLDPYSKKCRNCVTKNCLPGLESCTGCTEVNTTNHCQLPPEEAKILKTNSLTPSKEIYILDTAIVILVCFTLIIGGLSALTLTC